MYDSGYRVEDFKFGAKAIFVDGRCTHFVPMTEDEMLQQRFAEIERTLYEKHT
jgi:hypothetical protein